MCFLRAQRYPGIWVTAMEMTASLLFRNLVPSVGEVDVGADAFQTRSEANTNKTTERPAQFS